MVKPNGAGSWMLRVQFMGNCRDVFVRPDWPGKVSRLAKGEQVGAVKVPKPAFAHFRHSRQRPALQYICRPPIISDNDGGDFQRLWLEKIVCKTDAAQGVGDDIWFYLAETSRSAAFAPLAAVFCSSTIRRYCR